MTLPSGWRTRLGVRPAIWAITCIARWSLDLRESGMPPLISHRCGWAVGRLAVGAGR